MFALVSGIICSVLTGFFTLATIVMLTSGSAGTAVLYIALAVVFAFFAVVFFCIHAKKNKVAKEARAANETDGTRN